MSDTAASGLASTAAAARGGAAGRARPRAVHAGGGGPVPDDADLNEALEKAGVSEDQAKAITDENAKARINGLRSALSVLA